MAVLVVALLAAYVWYAIAAGRAARMLFIIAIMASPLSIKFLLGNQLDQALRDSTTMYLHQNDRTPGGRQSSHLDQEDTCER